MGALLSGSPIIFNGLLSRVGDVKSHGCSSLKPNGTSRFEMEAAAEPPHV